MKQPFEFEIVAQSSEIGKRAYLDSVMVIHSFFFIIVLFICLSVVQSNCKFSIANVSDDESAFFECEFQLQSDVRFVIADNKLFLSNVFQYIDKLKTIFCASRLGCNMEVALFLSGLIIKSLSKYAVDMAPVRAMQTFLRQQIVYNIAHGFDVEGYYFDTFSWENAPTFALVLHVNLNDYRTPQQEDYFIDVLVPSIRRASADLVKWSKVSMHLGFVITTGANEDESIANFQMGANMCSYLIESLEGVSVHCHGFAPVDWISIHSSDSDVVLHALPDNASMQWDTRWSVSWLDDQQQQQLSERQPDYYMLLDDSLSFSTSTWVLTALAKLAATNGYFPGLGVGVLQCSSHLLTSTGDGDGDAATDVEMLPLVPVLHKTHFDLFGDVSAVFPVHFSPVLNTMLLVDVYAAIDAKYSYCIDHSDVGSDSSSSSSRRLISELTYDELMLSSEYVSRVKTLREMLVMRLNEVHYQEAPLVWSRESLSYGKRQTDMLREVYASMTDDDRHHIETKIDQTAVAATVPVARVAYITAVFGRYEATLKYFARQSVPSDFICFTDDPESVINSNGGWIVDAHPYHLDALQYDVEHNVSHEINSLHNNQHPFNIAKYYKMNFHRIPRMAQYDVVVWLDGTIEVHNVNTSALVMDMIDGRGAKVVAFAKDKQNSLWSEVESSMVNCHYYCNEWARHAQPVQPVEQQYHEYIHKLGYNDTSAYWHEIAPGRANYGLWITCFVAFDMRRTEVSDFLTLWSDHNRRYSTQDQLSFPFVVQTSGVFPYTLPPVQQPSEGHLHSLVRGYPYINTLFYKHKHGL